MSQKMMNSLSGQVAALTFGSTALSIVIIATSVMWVFDRSLDTQFDNHLSAYSDLLVSGLRVKGTSVRLDDRAADVLQTLPRHWQINLPDGAIIQSQFLRMPFPLQAIQGGTRLTHNDNGTVLMAYQYAIDMPNDRRVWVTFGLEKHIAEAYKRALKDSFGQYVYAILIGISVFLCVIGFLIVLSVTRPLRRVTRSLAAVQSGRTARIEGAYPTEIAAVIHQANQLLIYAQGVMGRHRTFSANVGHALKTPLTVIRNETDSIVIKERVDDMLNIIERNLARIQTSGEMPDVFVQTPVKSIFERVIKGYTKIYDKHVRLICSDEAVFILDEADTFEVAGNLIENALKYADSNVKIVVSETGFTVEDDGPGIPEANRKAVMARGVRLDQAHQGSGIGLAITREVIELYGGTLRLSASDLGGLKVTVNFNQ